MKIRWGAPPAGRWFSFLRLHFFLLFLWLPCCVLGQTGGVSAPTGVDASDGAYSTKVGVAWDHVRDAVAYRIFRSTANDPASATSLGTTASVIFFDSTAVPEQQYFYWVQAENGNLTSGFSAPDQGFRAAGRSIGFEPVPPLAPPAEPAGNPVTGAKVYLGKTLFWDEQLSSTRTVACGTCHRARSGGSDPRSFGAASLATHPGFDGVFGGEDDIVGSPGVPLNRLNGAYEWSEDFGLREQVTPRKAQSVFNAGYTDGSDNGLFWDGRAGRRFEDPITGEVVLERGGALETQALLPILNTTEMGSEGATWGDVVARLREARPLALSPSIPPPLSRWIGERSYPELFEEAFGTPEITPVRIAMAIASYERTLFSDRTPFDAAVSGIREIPAAEKRGLEVFLESRCDECHTGALMADQSFRNIGVRPPEEDPGRAEVTGRAAEVGRFRTPSLRNVALRAPYMHNGRFATLEEVVALYDRGGDFEFNLDVGFIRTLRLTTRQKADLVAFLKNELTDPRVAAGAGPLFDRPMLYSESARVPQIAGDGEAAPGDAVLQVMAIEPPLAGNPSFTVGLSGVPAGAQAVLVIDEEDPGAQAAIPDSASFFRDTVTVSAAGDGSGYASLSLPIPDDEALIGTTLFGRWFVSGGGVSVSPAFRMTIFGPTAPAARILTSVSAASLALGRVAPQSIASGFGADLSDETAVASSLPLPATLAGVTVVVTDAEGIERPAPLFFASPGQINYQIPPGTAVGEAVVSVRREGVEVATGNLQVAVVAPALFAANANGTGTAAALVAHVKPDGSQTVRQAARFDAQQDRFVSAPIDLGQEADQVFLILFGTGMRLGDPATVTATIGGEDAEVLFAGPQPEFVGVDQVNLRIPRILERRGEVDVVVTVDGEASNVVRVNVR